DMTVILPYCHSDRKGFSYFFCRMKERDIPYWSPWGKNPFCPPCRTGVENTGRAGDGSNAWEHVRSLRAGRWPGTDPSPEGIRPAERRSRAPGGAEASTEPPDRTNMAVRAQFGGSRIKTCPAGYPSQHDCAADYGHRARVRDLRARQPRCQCDGELDPGGQRLPGGLGGAGAQGPLGLRGGEPAA